MDLAAALHERVLAIKLRGVGADLDQIAEAQSALAQLHLRWGNPSRARELWTEAVGTFKRRKGPRLAAAYEALAAVEEQGGRLHDALAQLDASPVRLWEKLAAAASPGTGSQSGIAGANPGPASHKRERGDLRS